MTKKLKSGHSYKKEHFRLFVHFCEVKYWMEAPFSTYFILQFLSWSSRSTWAEMIIISLTKKWQNQTPENYIHLRKGPEKNECRFGLVYSGASTYKIGMLRVGEFFVESSWYKVYIFVVKKCVLSTFSIKSITSPVCFAIQYQFVRFVVVFNTFLM